MDKKLTTIIINNNWGFVPGSAMNQAFFINPLSPLNPLAPL
jgi:hypothetical protein